MSSSSAVFVLSVSTDVGDAAGGLVAERVAAAGHTLVGRELVLPNAEAVLSGLGRRLADTKVDAVLVVGGTNRWASDAGSRAAAGRITVPLPGLAEQYRALAGHDRGPAVLLDDVMGGYTGAGKLVFALPSHEEGAVLMADLILPLLELLVTRRERALSPTQAAPAAELAKTPPAVALEPEEKAPVPEGVSVTEIRAPRPDEKKEELASGWEAGLRKIAGELRKSWPTMPEAFERLSASRDVLDQSGQRAEVLLADGRRYAAFGFPDLQRPQSKVLLVREGEPLPEIVALHRHPRLAGTAIDASDGLLPGIDADLGPLAEQMFGRPPPGPGRLFAVEAEAVYYVRDRRVYRWDGKRETDQGTPTQAYASLVLRWSQR